MLPQEICEKCNKFLEEIYIFKRGCLEAQMHLQRYLQQSQGELENSSVSNVLLLKTEDEEECYTHGNDTDDSKVINVANNLFTDKSECKYENTDDYFEVEENKHCSIQLQENNTLLSVPLKKVEQKEESYTGENQDSEPVKFEIVYVAEEYKFELEEHQNDNINIKCEMSAKNSTKKQTCVSRNEHPSTSKCGKTKRKYSCNTCGKRFRLKNKFNFHVRTHMSKKSYSCDTCGKSFPLKNNLDFHVRTHISKKSYSCDTCGKSFTQKYKFVYHSRTHTGERPYSCNTCGKRFIQKGTLTTHCLRVHEMEKLAI